MRKNNAKSVMRVYFDLTAKEECVSAAAFGDGTAGLDDLVICNVFSRYCPNVQ